MHGWCTAARARRQLVLAASGAQLLRWYVWDAAGCWHLSVQHSSCTTTCGGITARGIRLATASSWPTTWPYPHAAAIWWLYHSCTVQARYTQHHSGYDKIAAMYPKSCGARRPRVISMPSSLFWTLSLLPSRPPCPAGSDCCWLHGGAAGALSWTVR